MPTATLGHTYALNRRSVCVRLFTADEQPEWPDEWRVRDVTGALPHLGDRWDIETRSWQPATTADELDDIERIRLAIRDPQASAYFAMTPAEVGTWIDNNVTTIATARAVIKVLAMVLLVVAKRTLR